jgi:DNA-binding LacI/PurR family transcriptional regulator
MTDVARRAGVSHQTVSRVLNGHPSVRAQTRALVLAAVQDLGYRPNRAARTLVTGRSGTLGVITLAGPLYGPASTLYGIEAAARDEGFSVNVTSLESVDRESTSQAVGILQRQGVDGVIVIAPLISVGDSLSELADRLPMVAVEGTPEGDLPVVRVDQVAGAEVATRHLLGEGHATVWHLAGPPDWFEAVQRTSGWTSALHEAGAEVPPTFTGDWSPRSGYEAGQLLARITEVTAVFVANDQMALGMLRALGEHGRRVPEDVSIVGFDDIPESGYFSPPLTTVHQPFDEVGRRSLRLLLNQIDANTPAREHSVITPELVVRKSTRMP